MARHLGPEIRTLAKTGPGAIARHPGVIRRELTVLQAAAECAADAVDHLDLVQALLQREVGPEERAVSDADGVDLHPHPLQAATDAELAAVLQQYRDGRGAPPTASCRSGSAAAPDAATICTALTSGRPLSWARS